MIHLLILLGTFIFLYLFFIRIFAVLLSLLFHCVFNIEFKVGKVGFLSGKDIVVTLKNGVKIELDSIQVKSSLFTKHCLKPITLVLSDIRLQADKNLYKKHKRKDTKSESDETLSASNTPSRNSKGPILLRSVFKYSFLEYFAVQASNVSFILMNAFLPNCLFSSNIQKVDLQCNKNHNVCLSVSSVSWKLLQHETKDPGSVPCLLEAFYSLKLSACLFFTNQIKVKVFKIDLQNPQLTLHGDVLSIMPTASTRSSEDKVAEKDHGSYIQHVPQDVDVNVSSMKIEVFRYNIKKTMVVELKCFQSTLNFYHYLEGSDDPNLISIFENNLEGLHVAYGGYKLAAVDKIVCQNKFQNQHFHSFISCQSFIVSYNQMLNLSSWLKSLHLPSKPSAKSSSTTRRKLVNPYEVSHYSATVEISDVQLTFEFEDITPGISFGFEFSRLSGDVMPVKETVLDSSKILLDNFNSELLLDTVWCTHIEKEFFDPNSFKRHHRWNTPLVLGAMLITAKSAQKKVAVQGLLDSVQVEWGSKLRTFLEMMHKQLNFASKSEMKPQTQAKSEFSLEQFGITFSSVNAFCITDTGLKCAVLRVDSCSLKLTEFISKMDFITIGASLEVIKAQQPYDCNSSSGIGNSIIHLERLDLHRTQKSINISLLGLFSVKWSTTVHMVLFTLTDEIRDFVKAMKNQSLNQDMDVITDRAPRNNFAKSKPVINITVKTDTTLCAQLSSKNKVEIEFKNAVSKVENGQIDADVEELHILLNGYDMFQFQNVDVKYLPSGHPLQRARHVDDGFELEHNCSWLVCSDKVSATFPHQFNFADVASTEGVNIIKWLKQTHKLKSTTEGPMHSDLVIQLKEISVEIKDDPFEVKLRDNYELLEDEQKEWAKRRTILDEKVETIRKSNLLLPAGKLDELYDTLARRNAELYIKRCNQVYNNYTKKATLCLCTGKDIDIFIATDSSIHGQENVVNLIKEIDQDSPYPENGLSYSTLWCRKINILGQSMEVRLRDFPQSLVEIGDLFVCGKLIGAEQEASTRAKQSVAVEIEEPWCNSTLERGMQYLKFYHDLSCHVNYMSMAYGLCWEPVLSQLSQALEFINKPSVDPSPPLPFWDRARLLYHGRLTFSIDKFSIMLHASLDPYNMTEEMEILWTSLAFDWTSAKFLLKGDMDILIHTASKYDDCRLVHLPGLKLLFKLAWIDTGGNQYGHHSIVPCAIDRVPEYSSNEKHDSFRGFRSQHLDLSITLETKQVSLEKAEDIPTVLFYSSTMRWFENLKMILSGVSRPTRRGILFNNTKARKLQLSRHYKNIRLSICMHKISVYYWMSFAKDRGFELYSGRLSLSSEQNLSLLKIDDGLIHRPSTIWSISYMNCELNDVEMWLINSERKESQDTTTNSIEYNKSFFFTVSKVSYGRESARAQDLLTVPDQHIDDAPTHRLAVHNLRGSWTLKNRDLIFALIDAYQKTLLLKRNLSTEALKSVKVDHFSVTPVKSRSMSTVSNGSTGTPSTPLLGSAVNATTATPSPVSKLQSSLAANMLQKLISESGSIATVYTEELTDTTKEQQLHGIAACQTDDVLHKNWLIELVNSQVMLKGSETSGYMIISAAKTQILQRIHRPVWRNRNLNSKTTWVGSLECMQYYATVDAGDLNPSGDNIMWLGVDNIEEKATRVIADAPDMVGSGQSVGGVVSDTVGVTDSTTIGTGADTVQLQRIVSRCSCQFFYASYGEEVDADGLQEAIPLSETKILWDDVIVDSLTVVHNELNCSSNSQQYLMILDIINNLLLYTEPKKKESYEKLQRMRFQLQLSSAGDQKGPILQLQNKVRMLVQKLRRLEKEVYLIQKLLDDSINEDSDLLLQYDQLDNAVQEYKEWLNSSSEELALMISCFKESQISAQQSLLRSTSSKDQQHQLEAPARRNEVCFRHAKWRLTEADGQLGVADIVLANFMYSKITKNDDSAEHLQELGYVKIENLLPNQIYKVALQPTELQGNIPLDRQQVLRVYCREKAPVGGISIKEHFEINVIPFTISITHSFFKNMLKFFFPGRESENLDSAEEDSKSKKKQRLQILKRNTDDIEKMKERAEQNKLFLYIKIPEVPTRVSYKGEKEKNIEDVNDFSLLLPTLEYHSVTWTWLDLLMTIKNDSKKYLLSQALKQKLQIKSTKSGTEDTPVPQEEDKARMLLGSKLLGGVEKGTKRGLFSKNK